jgi:hypothetical protein
MTELRVMAVSSDGTRLVLRSADGQEFSLPIDDRLRAAVRADRARLNQIEIEVDSQLRPRDIQARIRAGATADEVAELAGIPVERVKWYEGPVLAERAFMAERAQNTQVRRQGETQGPRLGEIVAERLIERGADHDSAQWDSWRRDDGSWTIQLIYRIGGEAHEARWTFDPSRRLISVTDDEARRLSSEAPPPEPTYPFVPRIARLPQAHTGQPSSGPSNRQLSALSSSTNASHEDDRDDELAGLLDAVTGVRAVRAAEEPETSEAEEFAPPQPAAHAARASAGSAFENALFPRIAAPHRDRMTGTTDRQAEADGVRPGRRATVPSWDEIVFGSRRNKQAD